MAKAKQAPKNGVTGKKPRNSSKTAEKPEIGAARIAQGATAEGREGEGIKGSGKKKTGRPTKKTPAILKKICEGIAAGKSSRAMCAEVGISQPTLWLWLDQDDAFSKRYARAKEQCAELLAEEIIEIADDGSADYVLRGIEGDELVVDQEHVQRSRLRIDARKWYASKVAPKKYGDKVTQELTGPDGGPVQVQDVPPPDYSKIRALTAKHAARNARSSG